MIQPCLLGILSGTSATFCMELELLAIHTLVKNDPQMTPCHRSHIAVGPLTKKVNYILGCWRMSIVSNLREMIPPVHPTLVRPHLKSSFGQFKRHMELWDESTIRTTEMIEELVNLTSEVKKGCGSYDC